MKTFLYCAICVVFMGNLLAYGGNDYMKDCRRYLDGSLADYEGGLHDGLCIGYTRGVIETHWGWQQFAGRETFCLPDEAENDQFIRVAVKYLEDHPAQLHIQAAISIQIALREAFPCEEGN